MIVSKRIYYSRNETDIEKYIFLDYDPYLEEFSVRKGGCYKKTGSVKLESEEDEYQVAEFIEEFPEYGDKVHQLIKEFEEEYEN